MTEPRREHGNAEVICPVCKKPIGFGQSRENEAPRPDDWHTKCLREAIGDGCPVCGEMPSEDDFSPWAFPGDPVRVYHEACLNAKISEDTNAGLYGAVREGLLAVEVVDGKATFRITEAGERRVEGMLTP